MRPAVWQELVGVRQKLLVGGVAEFAWSFDLADPSDQELSSAFVTKPQWFNQSVSFEGLLVASGKVKVWQPARAVTVHLQTTMAPAPQDTDAAWEYIQLKKIYKKTQWWLFLDVKDIITLLSTDFSNNLVY